MDKIWRVALTEYLNAVRSKAFLLGLLALPVIICLSIGLQYYGRKKVDVSDRRVVVVDHTGTLFAPLAAKAKERNEKFIFDRSSPGAPGEQTAAQFLLEHFDTAKAGGQGADVVLSERVRRKEIAGFLVIGKEAVVGAGGKDAEISWFTQAHTFNELPDWLERTLNDEIRRLRFEQAGVDQTLVRKLSLTAPVKRLGLAKVDAATGAVVKAKEENRLATFAVPGGCMFLLYMIVMTAAPSLLNTVLEEKMQKISEVLLASVTPFQLMMGKLLGTTLVSLTLSALYLGTSAALLWKAGFLSLVPPTLFLWFLLFQILALLIFGSIFSAIGAACSEIRDAQNFMLPVMMLVMLPFFVWMPVMQSPTSSFARWMSLFPPATPMLMMLRLAIPPGPPWWEIALGVVLTTLFMLLCVWAGGKIFRIGLLAQGQSPSFAKLVRWILSK